MSRYVIVRALRTRMTPSWVELVRYGSSRSQKPDNVPNILRNSEQNSLDDETEHSLMKNAPKWKEKLASESEAYIKADREQVTSIHELQQRTVETVKKLPH